MDESTRKLLDDGFVQLPFCFDEAKCQQVLQTIRETRPFGPELFLSRQTFEAAPVFTGVNPRPGRNLYENLRESLSFIVDDPRLVDCLNSILGHGYQPLLHKLVCGVPESWIPTWLRNRILGHAVNNLGAYVRPEYRDITYFYGIDYHQDLIDWPGRDTDFVTLYVYLHAVGPRDAPLFLLQGSHALGATQFPHRLERLPNSRLRYRGSADLAVDCAQLKLVGPTGTAALWHAATLHGTQPDVADHERISLRLLFARSETAPTCGLDLVNRALTGPRTLPRTRVDLDERGDALPVGNIINTGRVR